MALRSMTVHRYEEIRRRLAEGRGVREVARALGCSRRTVREVRDGERLSPDAPKAMDDPLWMGELDWPAIIHDLGLGHPLKFLWEEKAQHLTTYSNFWKQFYRKFPQYREASVTAREFAPGERVEVDYAGDPIEWVEFKTGEIRKAYVFVAGLGFSHLLFAWAAEDMKSRNWLASHRRMFAFYGGVPHVTVPDCLKQGVLKCHLYDPDLNPGYAELAAQYATCVVPARVRKPRDKAVVEGLVNILMRYARFRYRRRRFTSLAEINRALADCVEQINQRRHSRFGVSRRERFETVEKAALKPLPLTDLDSGEWKEATLHPGSISKAQIKELYSLHWLNDARPVVLIGQTGVGKTFIAQATGLHACACGKSVLYLTLTTWLENLALARSSGTYLRYRDKLARPDIVIIDDFGMRKLSATEAQDLCELLEERSINKSTMFTTQLPLDHWSEVIADPVIADAIRDRLEHSALTIHITGESYRGVKARKLANKKKDG